MSDRDAWTQWAEKHPNPRTALIPAAIDTPNPNKYRATATRIDGYRFDSKREAARYRELLLLVAAGEITTVEVHPGFALMVPDLTTDGPPWTLSTIGMYHADFQYRNIRTGNVIVEDVKSKPTRTEAYKLRKRIVEAQYRIVIVEIT